MQGMLRQACNGTSSTMIHAYACLSISCVLADRSGSCSVIWHTARHPSFTGSFIVIAACNMQTLSYMYMGACTATNACTNQRATCQLACKLARMLAYN